MTCPWQAACQAAACQAALDNKAKKELEFDAEFKAVEKQKARVAELDGQLMPSRGRIARAVKQLEGLKPQELAEVAEISLAAQGSGNFINDSRREISDDSQMWTHIDAT